MITALIVSFIAGMATLIGGLLALHPRMVRREALAFSLALAAGAMIFLSLTDLMPHAKEMLGMAFGTKTAGWLTVGAFFGGILIVMLIDKFLPKSINPSEVAGREGKLSLKEKSFNHRLMRSGIFVAVVISLHNIPEGAATFMVNFQELHSGLILALAIALHNIPEGIAIAAPIYQATKSRKKALKWTSVSALTEPLGAVLMAVLVSFALPTEWFGAVLGLVAGMMVFISIDELLPSSWRYQTKVHQSIYGVVIGMLVVAVSLVLSH